LLPAVRPVVGNNGFGAGYHMIYAPAAYVVTFARLYSYGRMGFFYLASRSSIRPKSAKMADKSATLQPWRGFGPIWAAAAKTSLDHNRCIYLRSTK
jgi:hypothetical protein